VCAVIKDRNDSRKSGWRKAGVRLGLLERIDREHDDVELGS
jgi:hypothetical protein